MTYACIGAQNHEIRTFGRQAPFQAAPVLVGIDIKSHSCLQYKNTLQCRVFYTSKIECDCLSRHITTVSHPILQFMRIKAHIVPLRHL